MISTNGLRNTGIVALQLATSQHDYRDVARHLRAVLVEGHDNAAHVVSVTTNASKAIWVPPAGAASLGVPLPAGTIAACETPIVGLGSVSQPMQSIAGDPPHGQGFPALDGRAFATQGLRHRRLGLCPPGARGGAVAVAAGGRAGDRRGDGPAGAAARLAGRGGRPNNAQCQRSNGSSCRPWRLERIGELVRGIASPFVRLTVTNPPYLRLRVKATLRFSDDDTPIFWINKLNAELVKWLSPWPDPSMPDRPTDYCTRQAVAEFVRSRPYVVAIHSLRLQPEKNPTKGGWHYLTSALQHRLMPFTPTPDNAAKAPVRRAAAGKTSP